MRRDTDELLAAYVDGVTELSAEERRRVEARLAGEPAVRGEADATRALLGELRDLPRAGEPDWSALERSISDAVGPDVPRRWRGWRFLVPAMALATAGAIVVLVFHDPPRPDRADPITVTPPPVAPSERIAPLAPSERAPVPGDDLPLWLDGQVVPVALDDLDALEAELVGDEDSGDDGLLSTSDLEWIDELDEAELERAERWLDERPGRKREKS